MVCNDGRESVAGCVITLFMEAPLKVEIKMIAHRFSRREFLKKL